jgi:stage III sporulation protein AG
MAKWIKQMEQWIGGGPGGDKRVRTFRYLILIGLIGTAIMIFTSFLSVKQVDPYAQGRDSPAPTEDQQVFMDKAADSSPFSNYEQEYETQLQDILQSIVGVDHVDVMITIESTEEKVVKQNNSDSQSVTNEKDERGATRHITDISRSGEVVIYEVSDQQTPLVIKVIKPKIRGVIVVASGAENVTVKKLLVEAVQKGLDVPAHRISVIPRKQQ